MLLCWHLKSEVLSYLSFANTMNSCNALLYSMVLAMQCCITSSKRPLNFCWKLLNSSESSLAAPHIPANIGSEWCGWSLLSKLWEFWRDQYKTRLCKMDNSTGIYIKHYNHYWLREAILCQIGCFFTHCVKRGGSNPCVKIYVVYLYNSGGLLST